MPIIMDSTTPEGRPVTNRGVEEPSFPCVTRKMTAEERSFYGEAVPPWQWKRRPQLKRLCDGPPKMIKKRFESDEDFLRQMKRERIRHNITQKRLGIYAGLSKSAICDLETGKTHLTEEKKQAIGKVFGWDIEEEP